MAFLHAISQYVGDRQAGDPDIVKVVFKLCKIILVGNDGHLCHLGALASLLDDQDGGIRFQVRNLMAKE